MQSHGDNDHIGGLQGVLGEVPIAGGHQQCAGHGPAPAGPGIAAPDRPGAWDGVQFLVLHPAPGINMSANDRSCVVQVRARNLTLACCPGTLRRLPSGALLRRYGAGLKSDVLVVPHHGSKTSSTRDFTRAVAPDVAIFPVGYRNRFGLPNRDVVARYRDQGARLLSTAESGAIGVGATGAGITVTEHREKQRRFWHTLQKGAGARQMVGSE